MLQEQSSGMTWTILSTKPYQQIEQGFLQWLWKKEVRKQRTFAFFCKCLVVRTFRSIACAKELCQPLEGCQHLKPSQISTICTMHLPVTLNCCPYTKLLSSLPLAPSMHVSFPVEVAPKHLTSEKRKHNAALSWRSLTVGDNKSSFSLELQRKLPGFTYGESLTTERERQGDHMIAKWSLSLGLPSSQVGSSYLLSTWRGYNNAVYTVSLCQPPTWHSMKT